MNHLFEKKPVRVQAYQHKENNPLPPPDWFLRAMSEGAITEAGDTLLIQTEEGEMTARLKDWIIQGVKGEIYPCKPDIFRATYRRV